MPTARNVVSNAPKLLTDFVKSLTGTQWEGRLPNPTSTNIREFGEVLFTYTPLMNEFLSFLVNKPALTKVDRMYYSSKMSHAKRGLLTWGETIELIWVDVAKAHNYCSDKDDWAMLKQEKPNIVTAYVNTNRKVQYKVTINESALRAAFMSETSFGRFVDSVVNSMYGGNEMDEDIQCITLFANAINKKTVNLVHVDDPINQASANSFLTKLRHVSNNMTIPSKDLNYAGVWNTTAKTDQRLYITPKAEAVTSVESLAYAFNLQYAEFQGRMTMIPEIPGHPEIIAILADEDWLNIYDNLFQVRDFENPECLYRNYWLHVWQTYYLSPFHNAIAFTTGAVEDYTAVTVTPASATYTAGTTNAPNRITVATTPAGGNYTLTISGNTASSTRLVEHATTDGLVYDLEVGPEETGDITVTATVVGKVSVTKSTTITKNPG